MEHLINTILLGSANVSLKIRIRSLLLGSTLITASNAWQIEKGIQKHKPQLIIIDETVLILNITNEKSLIELISRFCLFPKTILIVKTLAQDTLAKYLKLGFTYITDIDHLSALTLALTDALLKKGQIQEHVTKYHGITLYNNQRAIEVKNCKIFLTANEFNITKYLIVKRSNTPSSIIQNYLEYLYQKKLTPAYITVSIARINKKTKQAVGIRLIRNRYRLGYYLSI
jgi:DNA-binding response OmpR family regulator